jgi:pantoate--beta-alanine ligase
MTDGLQIHEQIAGLRAALKEHRSNGLAIGLVPTMGNLHAGHISLLKAARADCDIVVATIFVNPLQFGAREDLSRYPRTFQADCEALEAAGCDLLFAPQPEEIYPHGTAGQTVVTVPHVSTLHCGKSRPGHFEGVSTVVCKLFNIVQPDCAWFGLKDYQQFHIISSMTRDLNIPVQLVGMPIIREANGLAMSSRNGYLSAAEREQATTLYRSLLDAARNIDQGMEFRAVEELALRQLQNAGMTPDYFSVCDAHSLLPATGNEEALVILAAAWIGTTRLIDNLEIGKSRFA